MEDDALVSMTIYPEVPPRVEYSLSERGRSICTIFLELRRWGLEAGTEDVECNMCAKCKPHIEEDEMKRKTEKTVS